MKVKEYWLVTSIFTEEMCRKVAKLCSQNIILKIAEKLKGILEFEFISINLYQNDNLTIVLKKDFSDENKFNGNYLLILNELLEKKIQDILIQADNVKELEQKIHDKLVKVVSEKELSKISDAIFLCFYYDRSYLWSDYIGSYSINDTNANQNLLGILVKILNEMVKEDAAKLKSIFNIFLSDNYYFPIFKRIVLHFIDGFWDECNNYLTEIMKNTPC